MDGKHKKSGVGLGLKMRRLTELDKPRLSDTVAVSSRVVHEKGSKPGLDVI